MVPHIPFSPPLESKKVYLPELGLTHLYKSVTAHVGHEITATICYECAQTL